MPMCPRAYPRAFPNGASIGADPPIGATPVGTIPRSVTNGLVAPTVQPYPWWMQPQPQPMTIRVPAAPLQADGSSEDYTNGFKLAQEDARRARTGAVVFTPEWVVSAGAEYVNGYRDGLTASNAVVERGVDGWRVWPRERMPIPWSPSFPRTGWPTP